MILLDLKEISKQYHSTSALNRVSLSMAKGEFLSILGPNGAGKTTLLKIMSGIMSPTSGKILYKDRALSEGAIKKEISYLGHKNSLYNSLSVLENIDFVCQLFSKRNGGSQIENILKNNGLWERRKDPVKELSQGMKRRLALIRGLITDPEVYIMDEPFIGLDLRWRNAALETIKSLKNHNKSLVLTTHLIEEGFDLADTVAFLDKGSLLFIKKKKDIDLEELKGLFYSLGKGMP
jgi:heme ABC exporter ATP-binding subunit CcmA